MKFLVYGFLVAFGLGAIAAPVVAGLLGAAGLAGSPAVRLWLFAVPEAILGLTGVGRPSLAVLVAGWTIEFLPLGFLIVGIAWLRSWVHPNDRAAAFEEAVTLFHESDFEAKYE
jgi:hypothetical protein